MLTSRTIGPITCILAAVFDYPFAVLVVSIGNPHGAFVFTAATGFGGS
jgi:hypothetical protein